MIRTDTILRIACTAAALIAASTTAHAQHGSYTGQLACLADQQVSELEAVIEYELCRAPERHALRVHTRRMHWLAQQIEREACCRGRTSLLRAYSRELGIKRDVIETLLNCIERRTRILSRHHNCRNDVPDMMLLRHMLCQLGATLNQLDCSINSPGRCAPPVHMPLPHASLHNGPTNPHTDFRIGSSTAFGRAIRVGR